jgi:hypothetical protein
MCLYDTSGYKYLVRRASFYSIETQHLTVSCRDQLAGDFVLEKENRTSVTRLLYQ